MLPSLTTALVVAGFVGTAIQIGTYFLVASQRLSTEDVRFYLLNLAGTAGLTLSLAAQWNLPSLVAQGIWFVIATVGLIRVLRVRKKV